MGVSGLWDILNKAGRSRSITHLTVVDGFEANESGKRAYRVGVDASIWYTHAENSTDAGENPELRLLFFRLCKLARLPIIPLFVFDGQQRPKEKRGSRRGKSGSHRLTNGFKELLDCFGMQWVMAMGEAEAELAYLNRVGVIDAVITDDVDALVFGARTVIRNMSLRLTGNKNNPALNLEGKESEHHVRIFDADAIESQRDIRMTRGGMILFALLSGGDYDKGVHGCGPDLARGLAHAGFGDRLLSAYRQGPAHLKAALPQWRAEMNQEIVANSRGFLPSRRRHITIPPEFPDLNVFENYANPICSGRNLHLADANYRTGVVLRDRGNLSIARIAAFCEAYFTEWGHQSAVLKRLRNVLWEGAVMNVLRRAALEADEKERERRHAQGQTQTAVHGPLAPSVEDAIGTPASLIKKYLDPVKEDRLAAAFVKRASASTSSTTSLVPDTEPLLAKITRTRTSVDTDNLLEYRVSVNPAQFVKLALSGIKGTHPEPVVSEGPGSQPTPTKKAAPKPEDPLLMWIPASIIRQVHPKMIADFEAGKNKVSTTRRAKRGTAVADDGNGDSDDDEDDKDEDVPVSHTPVRLSASQPVASSSGVRLPDVAQPSASQPLPHTVRTPASQQTASGIDRKPQTTHLARTPAQLPASQSIPVSSSHPIPFNATPPLHLPGQTRVFRNVGQIDTEETDRPDVFFFTFTDPDDPDYVLLDPAEEGDWRPQDDPMDPADAVTIPVSQPALPSISTPATGVSVSGSARSNVILAAETTQSSSSSTAATDRVQAPPIVRARRKRAPPQPAAVQVDSVTDDPWDALRPRTALSSHNEMFDQILGIVPGASKRPRKRTTASAAGIGTARKRARTTPQVTDVPGIASGSGAASQPAAKRRRAAQPAEQPSVPPSPPRLENNGTVQLSASQPPPRRIDAFPDLPPLSGGRSHTQPRPLARDDSSVILLGTNFNPRTQPRNLAREDSDLVVLASDDEASLRARAKATWTRPVGQRSAGVSTRTESGKMVKQDTSHVKSSRPIRQDSFLDGADMYKRLI